MKAVTAQNPRNCAECHSWGSARRGVDVFGYDCSYAWLRLYLRRPVPVSRCMYPIQWAARIEHNGEVRGPFRKACRTPQTRRLAL